MTGNISASRGLASWLQRHRLSFACTSYQTGVLALVGSHEDGSVALNRSLFDRAMGLAWRGGRLYLAGRAGIWRLENVVRSDSRLADDHDALLVPRNVQLTGDVDIHELGVSPTGRIVFVNTAYSCLATTDVRHSFEPVWTPPFISRLAPEDRCHLNGVAFDADGEPAYVSAAGVSDVVGGWRERKRNGGVILDVATGDAVAEGLAMPHSPRLAGRGLYFLESGRGHLVWLDLERGERQDIAFCPGFLRGLAIVSGFALVTVSTPREQSFSGLPIAEELARRGGTPWCAVLIVDLASGNIVEWLRFEGAQSELFDVVVLPGLRRPKALAPGTDEALAQVTVATAERSSVAAGAA